MFSSSGMADGGVVLGEERCSDKVVDAPGPSSG